MALSSCVAPALIADSTLEGWEVIGSGGFGQIYKARHSQWCCDVAVKLLHYDDGTSSSLLREVDMMRQGSSPYVIQVLGVFKGRLPASGPSTHLGLVMEFMERGTLAFLQDTLRGAPPWPLVFRLAHQVALGINFLHSLSPALLHLDLKPSNVLLDTYLNAKLTDFGLARFYHSVKRMSKKNIEEEGGTISYMPPEAFGISYSPTRASDIYSYGILLWSLVTGKQPYPNAMSSIVRFRIPQGDRPSMDDIRGPAAGLAGLAGLIELMQRSWSQKPAERPTSRECTTVTEELYKMHKHAIIDAVHQVLKKLDQKEEDRITEQVQRVHITQTSEYAGVQAANVCDNVPTGRPPIQEMANGWTANLNGEPQVKDLPSSRPPRVCHVYPGHMSSGFKVKPSSVHPIRSLTPSPPSDLTPVTPATPTTPVTPVTPATGRSPQGRTAKISQSAFRANLFPQYQRQFSSPDTFPCHSPPTRGICIQLSNVTGFQHGNNNTMHINEYVADSLERKRHPTAPSRVDLPPQHLGSWKNKTGGPG
ncbi:receptor-interacting serine/threonine-protein kinase 3 [Thunnus thynnus]|uniref:receptor-interacting serine/threonine-protein kinase 3 n=1 Tax=Thunnus thynnus TaxID=8237 RepID=UPI003527E949